MHRVGGLNETMTSNDLESFRLEWKREVATRNQQPASSAAAAASRPVASSSSAALPSAYPVNQEYTAPEPVDHDAKPKPSTSSKAPEDNTAIEHFADGVEAELEGRLPHAIHSYRKAFRLDPRADKAYHAHEQRVAEREKSGDPNAKQDRLHATDRSDQDTNELDFKFQRTLQLGPDYAGEQHPSSTQGFLHSLLDSFHEHPFSYPDTEDAPQPLDWLPNDLRKACRLRMLPDEIMTQMLIHLISPSVPYGTPKISLLEAAFAVLCRKSRLLSLSSDVWKEACKTVFRPPFQIPPSPHRVRDPLYYAQQEDAHHEGICHELLQLVALHGHDWRRCWIEQPRIRTDGAFISVISYIRKGENEVAWVSPTHIIVYYRFLRFYPNGQVVSLLTTQAPNDIARSLDLGLRIKGLSLGHWTLRGTHVRCTGLEEPMSALSTKYGVDMDLSLRSTQRGRHNKLLLKRLCTVRRDDGDVQDVPLQHNKTFFFSPVRSYEGW